MNWPPALAPTATLVIPAYREGARLPALVEEAGSAPSPPLEIVVVDDGSEAWRLMRLLPAQEVDVLAGTRILMAGRRIQRSLVRHLQGRVFATLVERAFRLGFYDTQCGLKLIRAAGSIGHEPPGAALGRRLPERLAVAGLIDGFVRALQ